MSIHTLDEEVWLPLSRDHVFPFFADAGNLDAITPPWLNFRILSPLPIEMKPGALIEYRLRLHGIPIFWRTEISEWNPPFHFVDRQIKGPYRKWVHTHTFHESNGGTSVHDHVEYESPGWILEPLINRFFVQRDVERIFQYRTERIRELLSPRS